MAETARPGETMKRRELLRLGICSALSLTLRPGSLAAAQASAAQAAASTTLVVTGDVSKPLSLTPAELKTLPRKKVEVKTEDGTVNVYEGVLAGELLKMAGVPLGGQMRGNMVASYVLASAADGYQALFAIAEMDPAFTAEDILVADTIDGKPLFEYQGPLRLVAPKDMRGARSVRMLQKLEVVRLRK